MVIALALIPILAAGGIVLLDAFLPQELIRAIVSSTPFVSILSVAVLAAVLAAAIRQRDRPALMNAWLFFFCGDIILSLGYLVEPFVPAAASWIEELFETVAFFPLLIFVVSVAWPLRLVMFSRAQRMLYPLLGVILLAGVAMTAFVPWFMAYEGPRMHSSAENLLHLGQTILDVVVLEPILLVLLVIGLAGGGRAYLLIAIGLLILLPEDIVGSYRFLRLDELYGQYAHLLFLVSQLYLLNGSLLSLVESRGGTTGGASAPGRGT
jgi:hypothetical protein